MECDFTSSRQLWVPMPAIVGVLQFYNGKIFIFWIIVLASCAHSVCTQIQNWTWSAWRTACACSTACFSSSQGRVKGRIEGTVSVQLSLYLHNKCSSAPKSPSWHQFQSPHVIKTGLCKSSIPQGHAAHAPVAWVKIELLFGFGFLSDKQ